jgi:uncharacterized membrane protein YczE
LKSKIFQHIAGFMIVALGIVGIINARLGASPIDAFNWFIYMVTPLSLGTMTVLTGLTVSLIAFIFGKKSWDMLISIGLLFSVGIFIDLWKYLFELLPDTWFQAMAVRIPMAILSIVIISIGTSLTITTGLAMSPFERLMMIMSKKVGSPGAAKMVIEGTFLLMAIILGYLTNRLFEQIHVFSVIMVLLNGPLVGLFVKKIQTIQQNKGVMIHVHP